MNQFDYQIFKNLRTNLIIKNLETKFIHFKYMIHFKELKN